MSNNLFDYFPHPVNLGGMAKKKQVIAAPSGPTFPPGSRVMIGRTSIWHGLTGVVESITDDIHRVRVTALNGREFWMDAPGSQLAYWPWLKCPTVKTPPPDQSEQPQ